MKTGASRIRTTVIALGRLRFADRGGPADPLDDAPESAPGDVKALVNSALSVAIAGGSGFQHDDDALAVHMALRFPDLLFPRSHESTLLRTQSQRKLLMKRKR